jgi:glycerol-3-phosphate dehydrogenase
MLPARSEALAAAQSSGIDVLVIGAGINGSATFRDLALQGVRCLLVDREDFGAGASSASSRMAHGGLRYLENGELRLVAEATRERNLLLHNAPHAVLPIPIGIPFFSFTAGIGPSVRRLLGGGGKLRTRGLLMGELGLQIYDWLGRHRRAMPRHTMRLGTSVRQRFPALHPAVRGMATYYDATVRHAERIAVELVGDGVAANPACVALNHCAASSVMDGGLLLHDAIDGHSFTVRPRLVVNAGGAWIDAIDRRLGIDRPLMGGTKGSHLVLDAPALHEALAGHGFIFDDGMGRVCIVYPFAGRVLLGATDIPIEDPDLARCEMGEVDYLLGAIRLVFPMVDVRRDQIRYQFAGVRPLPRSDAATPGAVSRDHSLVRLPPGGERAFPVLALVGGKWTTFRAFAEQATDAVLAELGRSRVVSTRALPIGGGRDLPATTPARVAWMSEMQAVTGLPQTRLAVLAGRYGSRLRGVAAACASGPDAALTDAPDYTSNEIRCLIRQEMAVTLDDLIFRRTNLAIEGRLTLRMLRQLTALLAEELTWSSDQEAAALDRTLVRLRTAHGVDFVQTAPSTHLKETTARDREAALPEA